MFASRTNAKRKKPISGTCSRRAALAAGLVTSLLARTARAGSRMDAVVRRLVTRSEQQARLFNAGRMDRWIEVAGMGDGFTLMQPFGGPASHGFDRSPEHLADLAASFRNGSASLELAQTVASEDIIVLVYVERQTIEVLGLPGQDWSLRVTQVFQRRGTDWNLVHRHADPLVRPIPLLTAAALAAGRALTPATSAAQ